jgi:hypothetical protein
MVSLPAPPTMNAPSALPLPSMLSLPLPVNTAETSSRVSVSPEDESTAGPTSPRVTVMSVVRSP